MHMYVGMCACMLCIEKQPKLLSDSLAAHLSFCLTLKTGVPVGSEALPKGDRSYLILASCSVSFD